MDDSYDQIARMDDYWTVSRSYSSTKDRYTERVVDWVRKRREIAFIQRQKEREDFRWRSGIGWRQNRKRIEMYIFGHTWIMVHGTKNLLMCG